MNRNVIKWLLIAAVIAGAAAYLILDNGKGGKEEPHETILEGHSKAFSVQPYEGFTVSAGEDALDQDREFRIRPVEAGKWEKAAEKLAEVSFDTPLMGFDIDAGLSHDERFPGVYLCQIDLKKTGIPANLYEDLSVWREDGGEMTQYNAWVKDGKLCFRSDRNSDWWVGLKNYLTHYESVGSASAATRSMAVKVVGGVIAAAVGVCYIGETWYKHKATGDLYKAFFMEHDDASVYHVDDPEYGDFDIHFRFRDTEWKDAKQTYLENQQKAKERAAELLEEARATYEQRKKVGQTLADRGIRLEPTAELKKLFGEGVDYDGFQGTMEIGSIYKEKLRDDNDYQTYLARMQPPPSIRDVAEFLKLSNRYLTDNQQLKPQTICMEVNLIDTKHAGESSAEYRHTASKHPYMIVNFDSMFGSGPRTSYTRTKSAENVLVTINHELLHHREKITKWMDFRTEETLASYDETAAARYFHEKGEMVQERSSEPSSRDHYETFGLTFNRMTFDANYAYTFAEFMDSLQVYTGLGKNFVPRRKLFEDYAYSSSHKANYMKWFGIKDEKDFDNYLKRFCMDTFKQSVVRQPSSSNEAGFKAHTIVLNSYNPIEKVTAPKDALLFRVLNIDSNNRRTELFNALIIPDKKMPKDMLSFCWSLSDTEVIHKDDVFMQAPGGKGGYYAGYFKALPGKASFTIVGLFQPDAPKIRSVKADKISFEMPEPAKVMVKERYIKGAILTYEDKNGNVQRKDVAPKYFGHKLNWKIPGCGALGNEFSLSVHWYYYHADSQTTYTSPESELATWGVKDKPKQEEYEGPAPTANYWKQTASRVLKQNSAKDESFLQTEETEPDYRSLEDIQVEQDSRSCEFTGLAAFEEKGEDGKKHYVKTPFLEGAATFTEPPKAWRPGAQYRLQWEIEENPYLLRVKEPFVFEAIGASSAQGVCRKTHAEKQNTGHSSTGKVDWMRSCWATFEAWSPEEGEPHFFTLSQTFTIQERPGSDRKTSVTLEYDYQWVGEAEPEKPISESVGHWQLKEALVSEEKLTDTNEDGTKATITGDNGRYHVHIDWWGVTDKAGHEGVIGTTDRDITFVLPKKNYMPGADLGVTMECGPVVEKGTVGKTDSPLPYPDGFMLYSYISRKQSKESREPYTFTLQQAPVIDMNTLHSFNFSIFQSVLAGGVRHCLLTIQYVYEWVGPPPEYQQEEDDQAALAREKYDNIDVSAYEYNPFE